MSVLRNVAGAAGALVIMAGGAVGTSSLLESPLEASGVAEVAVEDRCDMSFNTAEFNETTAPGEAHEHTGQVDFTLEEWADVFVDESVGIPKAAVLGFLESNEVLKGGILSGETAHSLTPEPWNPMVDEAECDALGAELARAKEIAQKYPTLADARADGYVTVTPYYPGIAGHAMKFEFVDDTFNIDEPEMLLFDGSLPESNILGLSYYVVKPGEVEPDQGFTGNNDHYHRHKGLCTSNGQVVAGSNSTSDECAALGGRKADGSAGWMNHVWVVPGCESDWGVFSGSNPALKVGGIGEGGLNRGDGCGTGLKLTDEIRMDTGGSSIESYDAA